MSKQETRKNKGQVLRSEMKDLRYSERKITSHVIERIREIDRDKFYLDFGFTSTFAYLTKELGYTPSAALRRIDAARMSRELPEIANDLKSGELNLTQVSILARGLREKKKSEPKAHVTLRDKKELLDRMKNQSLEKCQVLLAQGLDLEIRKAEKKLYHRDESVRHEGTFTKEEDAALERVKELISHTNPGAGFVELVNYLAKEFLKRKDPLRKGPVELAAIADSEELSAIVDLEELSAIVDLEEFSSKVIAGSEDQSATVVTKSTSATDGKTRQQESQICRNQKLSANPRLLSSRSKFSINHRGYIPTESRRLIFQRDQCCQWKDPYTQKLCGSKFQLQIDHKKPIWADGGNEIENLQLLCSVHNQLKYKLESGAMLSDHSAVYEIAQRVAC